MSVYSCNLNSTSTISTSDDPTVTSFYINANDSSDASAAVFTVTEEYDVDTIYNADSLPYNTRIDSLIPTIRFTSSDGFVINDTLTYNIYSTISAIDFSKPVKITNVASDGITKKEYVVDIRVHKIDPYLYIWTELNGNINSDVYENQKALLFNNSLYFVTNSSTSIYLYISTDGVTWTKNTVSGLPADASFQNNIVVYNNQFYLLHGNDIYNSADGQTWATITTDNIYTYKAILFEFKSKLFAIGQNISSGDYSIISSTNVSNWTAEALMDTNFPVSAFAATTFQPKYGNAKALVVGGYDKNGAMLNTRFMSEDGIVWTNLKNAKSPFDADANAGVAYYGSRLLLVESYYADSTRNFVRNSFNYGLNW